MKTFCNTNSIKITRLESGNISFIVEGYQNKQIIKDDLIILAEELSVIEGQVNNTTPYNLCWLSDINYHFRFTSRGMTVCRINDRVYQHDYTFSGKWINFLFKFIQNHTGESFRFDNRHCSRTFHLDCVNPVQHCIEDRVLESIKLAMLNKDENSQELKNCLRMVSDIAHGYSVPVQLSISFDDYRSDGSLENRSYYWYISSPSNGNKRLYNGGIIFHKDSKDNEYLTTGHYNLHT